MSTGFLPPTYDELRAAIVTIWKAAYGPNADTSSDTVDGLIIDLQGLGGQKIYDALGELYNQSKFGTATGLNIDALLELFGTLRKQATSTTVEAWLYGTDGTSVPALSTVATIDTGISLATQGIVTIADGAYNALTFPDISSPTLITVTIGLAVTSLTTSGSANAVRNAVAVALTTNTNVANVWGIGTQPDGQCIILIQKTSTWTASVTGAGQIYPATIGFLAAIATGPQSAAMGTVTRVVDSLPGWAGVVNVLDATPGKNAQNDPQYKSTHLTSLQAKGFATPRGLKGQLSLLDGVSAVRIYLNPSDFTDGLGRPPHSFEAVVLGGDQFAIAEQIWLCHTTGTQSYGNTQIVVVDDEGLVSVNRDIYFTRPISRYAWCRLTITRGDDFPQLSLSDVQSLLSEALEEWGNGLGIGTDIYQVQVSGIVTSNLSGVIDLTIELATTATIVGPPIYIDASITVGQTQISVWSATRVEVLYA